MLSRSLKEGLQNYEVGKEKIILTELERVSLPKDQIDLFNQQLETEIRTSFKNIMIKQDFQSLCSLLEMLCSSITSTPVKKSVPINMLDNVLECVGVSDLKKVLKVIRECIGNFGELEFADSNKLHRIINTLLKRISKTQDFQIRGELHMALTKILTLLNDSGFHYRVSPAEVSQIACDKNSLLQDYQDNTFTFSFFQNFWGIQKYFMDMNQLTSGSKPAAEEDFKMISEKIKSIQALLSQIIKYFNQNPGTQTSSLENFPLKFLKLPNLLTLQLSDNYFRTVIMIQALIFCFSLKNPISKMQIQLSVIERELIQKLEAMAQKQLQILSTKIDSNQIQSFLQGFFTNQLYWMDLKDNWKEKKKNYFKQCSPDIKQARKKILNGEQIKGTKRSQPSLSAPINLKEKKNSCLKQMCKKIGVESSKMEGFLKHTEAPSLKSEPTLPSFSYYLRQAQSCLDSFDCDAESQIQFDSRGEYNLFEWKTLRSLYRQSLKDLAFTGQNNSKFRDYRLLNLINKREGQFYDTPRKRTKPNGEQEE